MVETAEKIKTDAPGREYVPAAPSPKTPSAPQESDIDRVARYVRQNLLEVDATVKAIRGRLSMEHIQHIASSTAREAIATPERRRKGAVASGIGLVFTVLGMVLYLRSRRRRKGNISKVGV